MSNLRNIVTAIAFCLVLIGPICILACEKAEVGLPSWVTAEDAKYLSGGITDGNVKANLNLGGFSSGSLQTAISNEINNRIPFKAFVMQSNAALQRAAIICANSPFKFPVYPTYYGSTRLYIPSDNAVTYMPYKRSDSHLEAIKRFGNQVASIAAMFPNKRFLIYLVQGYQEPAANPAYALTSSPVIPSEYLDNLKSAITETPNVFVISDNYQSSSDYYEDFFKTDHHWNHKGIERAYNSIAKCLNLAIFESEGETPIDGYSYTGATARGGLCLLEETVYDTTHDFSNLTVKQIDGTIKPYSHDTFFTLSGISKRYTFYDSYYGLLQNGSTVQSTGEGNACIMSNSFGKGLIPYLADNYSSIYVSTSLHPESGMNQEALMNLVNQSNIDDFFFCCESN